MTASAKVSLREVLGLEPLRPALRQIYIAFAGDGFAPPVRWGLSSLRILKPLRVSLPTWMGHRRADRRAPIYNLFNRNPPPRHLGYSVRVTHCRDFRGRRLTYDSHNGTDFAVPVGTRIVAPAGGIVRLVRCDMQYGGLKVCVDHGGGLMTVANHLARTLVEVAEPVARGQVLGLSGMSGVDGVLLSPWLAPHLHFTVILDGAAVDPFARDDERALWHHGNAPLPPCGDTDAGPELGTNDWSCERVDEAIGACRNEPLRSHLESVEDFEQRAAELAFNRVYFSHSFAELVPMRDEPHTREPWLDLPLHGGDATGAVFVDEV